MKLISMPAVPTGAARRIAAVVLASSLFVASAGALAAESTSNDQQATAAPTTAKWVQRKVHFMYSAAPDFHATYYSCDALQARVKTILKQLGARDEIVKPTGCITTGPEKFPGIDATFSVLQPVGSGDQDAASGSKDVKAQWDKVSLKGDSSCALIEQVKRSILPLFATRNQSSGCSDTFTVDVLRPAKTPPVS
jgi:hypothetical protein